MPTIQAKDLTKDFPRSPYEQLGGIPWLARMIDKVRALTDGKIGEYTPYPCGGDQNFIKQLGVDADTLKGVIANAGTDEEVLTWVKANAAPGYEERLAGYIQSSQQPLPAGGEMAGYLDHAKGELAAARPELDLSGVTNFAELICVEEGHALPAAR